MPEFDMAGNAYYDESEEEAGSPEYLQLLADMRELHINKNAGYAGVGNVDPWANFRMSEAFGVTPFLGVLTRMSDKYIRITNLVKDPNNEKVGESLDDTLMDLAAYALIAICLRRQQQQHELDVADIPF